MVNNHYGLYLAIRHRAIFMRKLAGFRYNPGSQLCKLLEQIFNVYVRSSVINGRDCWIYGDQFNPEDCWIYGDQFNPTYPSYSSLSRLSAEQELCEVMKY